MKKNSRLVTSRLLSFTQSLKPKNSSGMTKPSLVVLAPHVYESLNARDFNTFFAVSFVFAHVGTVLIARHRKKNLIPRGRE